MNKVFHTPENFNAQGIKGFLDNVKEIFSMNGKQIPNVFFDVSRTKKINIIGQLLIYKFLEYTFHKECFLSPTTNLKTKDSKIVNVELKQMGFKKLVDECFTEQGSEDENFVFQNNGICFVSPIILDKYSAITGVGKENERKISSFYKYNNIIANAILLCLGEIASNFQEHAEIDTRSVIVAKGDKQHFEIACADTGTGIVSSLSPIVQRNTRMTSYDVLKKAIERGISSKLSEGHMGCGLWLVNEYVTKSEGYMCIYSEHGYIINKKGKIKSGESPFWKGTIIYIDIPLKYPDRIAEVIYSVKPNNTYV